MAQIGGKLKKINKTQDAFITFAEEMKANIAELMEKEKKNVLPKCKIWRVCSTNEWPICLLWCFLQIYHLRGKNNTFLENCSFDLKFTRL